MQLDRSTGTATAVAAIGPGMLSAQESGAPFRALLAFAVIVQAPWGA